VLNVVGLENLVLPQKRDLRSDRLCSEWSRLGVLVMMKIGRLLPDLPRRLRERKRMSNGIEDW